MTIQKSVNSILEQLEKSIMALSDDQYTKKIDTLSGASIGEHVRHVIELFVCLFNHIQSFTKSHTGCDFAMIVYYQRLCQ